MTRLDDQIETARDAGRASPSTPERTAKAAYLEHLEQAQRYMEQIKVALIRHRDDIVERGRVDWADVGDLAHVNDDLSDVVEFLGGTDA